MIRNRSIAIPLRYRVMAAFALVSVVVTGLLATLTWRLSSSYMIDQRQQSAVRQARVNAQLVQTAVARGSQGLQDLLTGLGSEVESAALLVDRGEWISSGNLIDPRTLPAGFVRLVESGQSARQRLILAGAPILAVGLPLTGVSATYVEVFPLRELDRTLRYISSMLAIGVLVSGVAGAVLGRWASSRALAPLWRLTDTAGIAARGDLSVRLADHGDRDLAPLAQAFNETAERLQHRAARDARFASDVSHELRSPLTTMVNAMAVLKRRRAELTDTSAHALDLLDFELTRFQRMVADLLEISLADQGAAHSDLEKVDLGELVRQTAQGCGFDDSTLEIVEPAPRVLADRRRLERAIANLLANAQEHGLGVVRLAVQRRGGQARIEVDDAGPGVPAEFRDKIFERFGRGPASGASGAGTGLGLALVSEHVRRHGGQVWVTDREPSGARFVIELREQEP